MYYVFNFGSIEWEEENKVISSIISILFKNNTIYNEFPKNNKI